MLPEFANCVINGPTLFVRTPDTHQVVGNGDLGAPVGAVDQPVQAVVQHVVVLVDHAGEAAVGQLGALAQLFADLVARQVVSGLGGLAQVVVAQGGELAGGIVDVFLVDLPACRPMLYGSSPISAAGRTASSVRTGGLESDHALALVRIVLSAIIKIALAT